VFDEAHKATKNHSFCAIIKEIEKLENQPGFRMLSLSATPVS
jgi:ERCC4-related helicase